MSKKSLNKKYWILVKSNNKWRCFSTTDVRTILNVLVRYNPDFELIGIYGSEIGVSCDDWVEKCDLNGSEEENLVGLRRNYSNKEILLKHNSFEVTELKYFAYCASERLYIKKNEFEDIKWEFSEMDLKFGEVENLTFVSDEEVGDYDIRRFYNAQRIKKLINGYEVNGWVLVADRRKKIKTISQN